MHKHVFSIIYFILLSLQVHFVESKGGGYGGYGRGYYGGGGSGGGGGGGEMPEEIKIVLIVVGVVIGLPCALICCGACCADDGDGHEQYNPAYEWNNPPVTSEIQQGDRVEDQKLLIADGGNVTEQSPRNFWQKRDKEPNMLAEWQKIEIKIPSMTNATENYYEKIGQEGNLGEVKPKWASNSLSSQKMDDFRTIGTHMGN